MPHEPSRDVTRETDVVAIRLTIAPQDVDEPS